MSTMNTNGNELIDNELLVKNDIDTLDTNLIDTLMDDNDDYDDDDDDDDDDKSILINALKLPFLQSLRLKTIKNNYFIFDGYIFFKVSNLSLKDLTETQKKEKKIEHKVYSKNYSKLKSYIKKGKITKYSQITDISNSELHKAGIKNYEKLTEISLKLLKDIETFTVKFDKLVIETGIKKTIDMIKAL